MRTSLPSTIDHESVVSKKPNDIETKSPRLNNSTTSLPSVVFGGSSSIRNPWSSSHNRNVPEPNLPSTLSSSWLNNACTSSLFASDSANAPRCTFSTNPPRSLDKESNTTGYPTIFGEEPSVPSSRNSRSTFVPSLISFWLTSLRLYVSSSLDSMSSSSMHHSVSLSSSAGILWNPIGQLPSSLRSTLVSSFIFFAPLDKYRSTFTVQKTFCPIVTRFNT